MIAWLIGGLLHGVSPGADGEDGARAMHPLTESVVLKAAEVHTGTGKVFRPGTIILLDSEIVAVGSDPGLPLSPRIIDLGDACVTPGLIDAACQLGTHDLSGFAEQSSEVIPHLDTSASVDLHSRALQRLAAEGVTTVYVTPEAASVIGSRGAVVKTGGAGVSRLLDAPPSIKANIGPETVSRGGRNGTPSNFRGVTFMTRRPTTRMGAVWVFREAFYDALRAQAGLEHGSDPEAMAALASVLSGETRLRFQARKAHDIQTAQRLCSEFGIQGHVLEYGHEAFRCLDVLAAQGTPVIYGPIFVQPQGITRAGDSTRPCLGTVTQLRDAGVPFCLTACDLVGEEGLARQAGRAIRMGLSPEDSLRAVSSGAAELLGVQDQVGTLDRGRHADLVVWNGTPFADTSKVILTLIDGKPVHDPDDLFAEDSP